ncbi:YitT family protein [Bacillus sp. ISL-35]|uniref:YitT family protein n=1 Tax=Bacillus sp. ISL-35 TaxID=2819122 RepID=UPI001BE7E4C0|nr:YitT family protein [Bacillus sp. ISL-35]MBT2681225.1 YitT family protein [Bacillus sp. ISL-35]MBT2705785.1 YitT family protein [Chryseobacterium sp. ISL-80]
MKGKLLAVLVGSLMLGVGVNGFLVPHHLLDGGMIGIGLIIHYFYGFPAGLTMNLLSLPLFLLAWILERKYFFHSLYGLLASSLFIDLFVPVKRAIHLGILPSAFMGGILVGCGIGLMLRYETSTGGTDLFAQLIHKFFPLNVGILIFIIDGIVVLSGLKVIGMEKFIFSLLTITCAGFMTSLCVIKRRIVY